MKGKLLTILGLCVAFAGSSATIHAADESPLISFDGDSAQYFEFNTDQNAMTDKFTGMMPGETRSETFTLVNNDSRELKFFLDTHVLKDLETNPESLAVYEITFSRDGEVFYQGTVGGEDGSLVDLSGNSMGDSMLMAELKENESTEIEMTIGIDGDSMDNSYQNAIGSLQFVFAVQEDDPIVIDQEPTIVQRVVNVPGRVIETVGTGIKENPGLYAGLLLISGGVIIALIVVAKKRKAEEGE